MRAELVVERLQLNVRTSQENGQRPAGNPRSDSRRTADTRSDAWNAHAEYARDADAANEHAYARDTARQWAAR